MVTPASAPSVRHSTELALSAGTLLAAVAQAQALISLARARAFALPLDVLGDIDLPPVAPATADDQAQVRSIGPLYLASQLEHARLLPTVESLSSLAVSGGLPADLGQTTGEIALFWRGRNERFQETERRAFFARLFGADDPDETGGESRTVNAGFENCMIDLCEALYKLDEDNVADTGRPSGHAVARLTAAATNLAGNVLHHAGGMTAFAAEEILKTVQAAIHILQQLAARHVFAARSLWDVVRTFSARYGTGEPDIANYVTRGKSGLIVLSWLADALPGAAASRPIPITFDHPVIGAAADWLQASLAIRQASGTADHSADSEV
jgi:hypothetical protein